ncbi:MAG: hypothetical protein ACXADH_06700 [Candidatus Kariarchaeaceae archaeon]|jgi:hypothetical protein
MNKEKEIQRLSNDVARLWSQVTTGAIFSALNEPTGFLNRTDSVLSFVGGTRTFTITPTGAFFNIWQQGVEYSITAADSIVIPDTAGVHAIYYDAGVLTQTANPSRSTYDDLMVNRVLVGLVYWNATDNAAYVLGDERHGSIMSGRTHEWIHDAIGAVYREGFTLSGYTENVDNDAALNFEITDGEFYDEDIEFDIDDGAPANQYEQQLNGGNAELPILYRDDIDGSWKEDAATTLPYKSLGAGRLAYNKDDGDGTFSQVEITDNKFVTMTIIATNDWQYPIKAIQGQNEYTSKQNALEEGSNEILAFGDLLTPETVVLYRIILNTKNTFGGTKKAKIVTEGVVDFRTSDITGASAAAQDHGTLAGLSDDDHAQYLLADATRDLTGNWTIATNNITLSAGTLTARIVAAGDVSNLGNLYCYDGSNHKMIYTTPALAADITFSPPNILDIGKYLKCGAAGVHSWDTPGAAGDTFTYYDPGKPLAVPSTEDDHFDDSSIHAKWHAFQTGANVTHSEGDHHLQFVHVSGDTPNVRIRGRFQDVAASDFTAACKISITSNNNVSSYVAGLYLFEDATSNPNTCDIVGIEISYINAVAAPCGIAVNNFDDWSTFNSTSQAMTRALLPTAIYLRIRQNSTTLTYEYSLDGIGWLRIFSGARAFAPAEVGLCSRNSAASGTLYVYYDWFRYIASDQIGLIGGVRTVG